MSLLLSVIQGEHTYQVLLVALALLLSRKIKRLFGQMDATSSRYEIWTFSISVFHFYELFLGFTCFVNDDALKLPTG